MAEYKAKNIKVPIKILETLLARKITKNEIRFLIWSFQWVNSYGSIEKTRSQILKEVFTIDGRQVINNKTLSKILIRFKFVKIDKGYIMKLNGEHLVSTKKGGQSPYLNLSKESWEVVRKNKDELSFKLLLWLLIQNIGKGKYEHNKKIYLEDLRKELFLTSHKNIYFKESLDKVLIQFKEIGLIFNYGIYKESQHVNSKEILSIFKKSI